jgi:hypothetical protein
MSNYVQTIPDLKAASYSIGSQTLAVLGYNSAGDGGGGEFYFDATSTQSEDGGMVIKPNSILPANPGRWKRVVQGDVNVRWFGAYGNGVSDDRAFIKSAILYAQTLGLSVYLPAGVYKISAPLILQSNARLYGDGASTVIVNATAGSPHGNCVHIGVGYEYGDWNGTTGAVVDARLSDFDGASPDYSRITTQNCIVENICVKSSNVDGGLGVWTLNASEIIIRNIWSDGCATPVNVANDSLNQTAACRNVDVSNVFVIKGGKWYDLVFIGEAENINVSNCFNNPESLSTYNEMIVSNQGRKIIVSNCQLKVKTGSNTKFGISIGAEVAATPTNCLIKNNIIENLSKGVVFYNAQENTLDGNRFISVNQAVQTYSTKNIIQSNSFNLNPTQKALVVEYDANLGVLHGNVGLDLSTCVDSNNLLQYWNINNNYPYFNSNPLLSTPLTKRYNPIESFFDLATFQKINELGAILRYNTPGSITIYYKIPETTVKISQVNLNWYSNAVGEKVSVSVVGQDVNAGQMNAFNSMFVGALQQSTAVGDTYYSTQPGLSVSLGSSLYLKVDLTFSSIYSQLRDVTILAYLAG